MLSLAEIIPHLGRYCEVTTVSGRLFGELIRISTALFMVRSTWPAAQAPSTVSAHEIVEVRDLKTPRS
jgi:hypothetical protein